MADDPATLQIFYENWKEYMDTVKVAIAPLSAEQLDLRAAPQERSVGELARHIVGARLDWFQGFMGEDSEEIAPYARWNEPDVLTLTAADLVEGFDVSWRFMAERLEVWTPADMRQTFPLEWRGQHYDLTRSWV